MDGCPADLGGEAGEDEEIRHEGHIAIETAGSRVNADVRKPDRPAGAVLGDLQHYQPEERDPEPERRQDEVFPGGFERAGLPEYATSSAEAAEVTSTSSQAAPRFAASGTARSAAQKTSSAV